MSGLLTAVVVIASMSSIVLAESESPDETQTNFAALGETPLRMNLDVGAWLVRAKGTASNRGAELQMGDDTSSSLDLGNLRGLLRGELTLAKDPWAVRIMGTHGSWSGTANLANTTTWGGQTLTSGVDYDSSFDMSWMAVEGHWYPVILFGDGRRDTVEPVEFLFGPHVGVTWLDLDQSLAGVDNSASWWTAYAGADVLLDIDLRPFTSLLHGVSVDFGGSVGKTISGGGLFYKVRAGMTLHITPNVGATIGYRLMEYHGLEDGSWNIAPSFPGLFVGANVTF